MPKKKFTLMEQIGCVDRQIGFFERVVDVFENEDPNEVNRAREEIECLKSIRETLQDGVFIEEAAAVLAEQKSEFLKNHVETI
jgi:hypothetical protein